MSNEATLGDLRAIIDRALGKTLDDLYRQYIPLYDPEETCDAPTRAALRDEAVRFVSDQIMPEFHPEPDASIEEDV